MKTYDLIVVTSLMITCIVGCKESPTGPDSSIPKPPLPRFVDYPAWHPDGEWIAVEHGDSVDTDDDGKLDFGFGGIWLVHAETGEKQPLVSGFQLPAWSPDGKKLAMVRGGQIFTINVISLKPAQVDTNSLLQLTAEGGNFFPAWSPDGERIVYDSNIDDSKYDIWIIESDGESKKNISGQSDSLEQGGWRMPNWSHSGEYIVHKRYMADADGGEIAMMDTAGKNSVRLTFDDREDAHPKYSPDGTKIAFYSKPRTGPESVIRMINSDGSNLRTVSPEYAWRFDWSPDGTRFIFLFWNGLEDMPGNGELWLINTDGTGLRQLTYFK